MADWHEEVSRLDIVSVAEKLGIQVAAGRRWPRLALCPFHDDSAPSLHLYKGDNPHYHCFVCHEHGDIVELVKQRQGVDFPEALRWLETNFGLTSSNTKSKGKTARQDILTRAFEYWRNAADARNLKGFANARKFSVKQLLAAGMTVGSVETFVASLRGDREAEESAVNVGLAFANNDSGESFITHSTLAPFARGEQLFIPLSNLRGRVNGVMARAISGKGPKYRFTAGFSKSEILYRADYVRRQIEATDTKGALDGDPERFDLCLCEGVFDALRLESLGIPAVAILGTSLSDKQLEILAELADVCLERGRVLRLHIFFDADKAGRRGIADCLPRLLEQGLSSDYLVDVVAFDRPEAEKADPDILFQTLTEPEAKTELSGALISAMDALAAITLEASFSEAPRIINELDAAGSIMLQNRLARRLQKLNWPKVWRRLSPDRTSLTTNQSEPPSALALTYERLTEDLDRDKSSDLAATLPEPFTEQERGDDANLLHALILARESTDSREYPVDVAAWDRLEDGSQVFLPLIIEDLASPEAPKRPYLAHFEAKDSGAPRLKCGPCPEEAVQQQYVLTELLKVRPERQDIAHQIPAVRFWADHPTLVVTGVGAPQSAVSFAYQVDMRALEERPDRTRRRDMFRPFLDCWNSFILHIGNRIEHMRSDLIYIARLDVKGFYDNVPRHEVERILDRALPENETLDTLGVAKLFGAKTTPDRRQTLISWILKHSFGEPDRGYAYFHPSDGHTAYKGGPKGIPQGPVLSSYLANIVLFDLDAELERRVTKLDNEARIGQSKSACGAIYARYVDDIIIAARRPEDLQALRSLIEARLEPLGLELNEKSEHLDPMTAEDARNWLVERRGAGFVAYGEVDDQPSPAPDIRTGWSDIPTLDRRAALSLLYWSALDDPTQTTRQTFEQTLDTIAKADGLRPTDLSHIARRIVLRAALDDGNEALPDKHAQFLGRFQSLVTPLKDVLLSPTLRNVGSELITAEALSASRLFFAVLAGLERLITGNPENNPTFSVEVCAKIATAKDDIVLWILNDRLLRDLYELLVPEVNREAVSGSLSAQIQIMCATLEERAARLVRLNPSRYPIAIIPRPVVEGPQGPSSCSVRIGWFRTFAPDGLIQTDPQEPTLLFHAIAAEIQAASGHMSLPIGTTNLTPPALSAAMLAAGDTALRILNTTPNLDASIEIAKVFRALAGSPDHLEPRLRMRAISAFLALSVGRYQAQVLQTRSALLNGIAGGGVTIPLPPIPDQPGLFCYNSLTREVRAIIVTPLTDDRTRAELPLGLTWIKLPENADVACWAATLPEGTEFLLDPQSRTRTIDDDLRTIANVFDSLIEKYGSASGPRSNLVHVFSLIGPSNAVTLGDYLSLSWSPPRSNSEQLIFERRGEGIATQRSPHAGTHLWRIGQSVADLFSIPSDGADESSPLKLESKVLQDRLKRMAFSRLRGRWINGVQVAAALATNSTPKALKRIIDALRETAGEGAQFGPLALEFFLSGRAMRTRMKLGPLIDTPGGWSRFLELVGSRSITPGDDEELFTSAELRTDTPRTVRALSRIADSIAVWSQRAEPGRTRNVLSSTALSFELSGFRSQVRDFALAILAMSNPADRDRIRFIRPNLGPLSGLGELILIEPLFYGAESRSGNFDLEHQCKELFSRLASALSLRALQGRVALERISTVGWLVILSVFVGVLGFDMAEEDLSDSITPRPAFPSFQDLAGARPLLNLATLLAGLSPLADADPEAWPWEISDQLDHDAVYAALIAARNSLNVIGAAIGIREICEPAPLRTLTLVDDTNVEFITGDGESYRLPWWRCTLLTTSAERIDRSETIAIDDRLVHPYSALKSSTDRILIVQVVSESLAAVAGLQANISGTSAATARSELIDSVEVSHEFPGAQAVADVEPDPVEEATPATDAADPIVEPTAKRVTSGVLWRERQNRSWKSRGANAGVQISGYGRIALLQYDFEDSYFPLEVPSYRSNGTELSLPRVIAGPVDYKLSFGEHRRRQVLTSVLECCDRFGVEALVLPEVSLRPETVNWLDDFCQARSLKISIWTGTFRQQPGFELTLNSDKNRFVPVAPSSSVGAIMPADTIVSVLFRETQLGNRLSVDNPGMVTDERPIFGLRLPETLRYRKKKYPSVGMYEDFRPSIDPLKPIMAVSKSLNRIESFVSELICSELFVFNGPLNWVNLATHLDALSVRYHQPSAKWLDLMVDDAREFANVYSGGVDHRPKRSILFLPCATTRDADYHYFAQSAYLASGIITVFCNATHDAMLGGSCFIGPGGWESQGSAPNLPGPYHGVFPGILTIANYDRGALGKKEAALVIADIRPDRTVDDKPRSQTLGAPMKLVAHIPIVEDKTYSPVDKKWDANWWKPRKAALLSSSAAEEDPLDKEMHDLLRNQIKGMPPLTLEQFGEQLGEALDALTSGKKISTLNLTHAETAELVSIGLSLSALFPSSPGMKHRATKMIEGLRAHPEAMPCPALMDWLIVRLEIEKFDGWLAELAKIKGEIQSAELSPSLRSAPWGWVPPPAPTRNKT